MKEREKNQKEWEKGREEKGGKMRKKDNCQICAKVFFLGQSHHSGVFSSVNSDKKNTRDNGEGFKK